MRCYVNEGLWLPLSKVIEYNCHVVNYTFRITYFIQFSLSVLADYTFAVYCIKTLSFRIRTLCATFVLQINA